jgi:hypothetical protein
MRTFSILAKEVREFNGIKRYYGAEKLIDPNLLFANDVGCAGDFILQSMQDLGLELNHEIEKYEQPTH